MRRRDLLALAATLGCTGCVGGDMESLTVESPAFDDGDRVPDRHTCDGADVSPALDVSGVPDEAGSLAIVVDDPDAPSGTFVHWTAWNLPASVSRIPEGVEQSEQPNGLDGGVQGSNDFGEVGYRGPCPPEGDGDHRYRFRVYAVEGELGLSAGSSPEAVADAVEDAKLAEGTLTGVYSR